MTPLMAKQDSESDQWLPSVMPPGQEMSDYVPKTDPVGQFKIPQTENWGTTSCVCDLCCAVTFCIVLYCVDVSVFL